MEASQLDMKPFVDLHLSFLDFNNTPRRWAEDYDGTTRLDQTSTERLFLDTGGFSTWFAHFLTKRAAKKRHFEGQAACNQLLSSLNELDFESRKLIAQTVKAALPSDFLNRIQDIWDKAGKSRSNSPIAPHKRKRTVDGNDRLGEPATQSFLALANSVPIPTDANQSSTRYPVENPPLSRVTTVFPWFLADSIRKQPPKDGSRIWSAAITMLFFDAESFGENLGSMMSLEITSNKVEYFAKQLFGAHIESKNENRYYILPFGLRITPFPTIILQGCKREAILGIFGNDISRAIKASPAYKEETEQAPYPLTDCVTMTISHQAGEGALINLSLDEKEGVLIKEKLYG